MMGALTGITVMGVMFVMGISIGFFAGWLSRKRVRPPGPSEQQLEHEVERSRRLNAQVRRELLRAEADVTFRGRG